MKRQLPIAVLTMMGLLAATHLAAQSTFTVTVAEKTEAHPYFGQGWNEGYVVDGVQGKEVVVMRGQTYTFQMSNVPEMHPFYLTLSESGSGAPQYSDGVTGNNATGNSAVTFTPSESAPDLLYYQCGFHPNMGSRIVVQGTTSGIERSIADRGAAIVAWPNPIVDRGTVALRTGVAGSLAIELYDMLGRRIATLFSGDVTAGDQVNAMLDATTLEPGSYIVRARGDGISAATRVAVQ